MKNDVLPGASAEPGQPVSSIAVLAGVLAAYGAYALLISLVAAFANGAHSHQVLSGATWKQLGTGGGIVAGIVLFVAWAAGGFFAARMARRDGMRHGVWVFIVGVVLITVVGAAITWLPDTSAILRNLRLLGLPVRRNEWRDIGTVAGIASLLGMAAGAAVGGRFALLERAAAPGRAPAVAPVAPPAAPPLAPPPTPVRVPSPPEPAREHARPEPAVAAPSLFEQMGPEREPEPEPERAGERVEAQVEPAAEPMPAWQQYVETRQREFRERDRESPPDEGFAPPEPAPPAPTPPAPWDQDEPVPTFLSEPEEPEPEPAQVTSWWPEQEGPGEQPAPATDEEWALPDQGGEPPDAAATENAAFPHPPPTPEPEPVPEAVVVVPPEEHAGWRGEDEPYRSPPEATDDDVLQHAPEAPPPPPEVDAEEREERRRQQEEAARAYDQAREEQPPS